MDFFFMTKYLIYDRWEIYKMFGWLSFHKVCTIPPQLYIWFLPPSTVPNQYTEVQYRYCVTYNTHLRPLSPSTSVISSPPNKQDLSDHVKRDGQYHYVRKGSGELLQEVSELQ